MPKERTSPGQPQGEANKVMAMRIKVKPDADGIIRVQCGEDTLEIDTSDDWSSSPPVHFVPNPLDDFYTFHKIGDLFGIAEIDRILGQVRAIHEDPARRDPKIVAVGAPAGLEVHGVAKLMRGIKDMLPGATLAFDLDRLDKL
jgi:hypothetical protein